jgi:hypothetical protein
VTPIVHYEVTFKTKSTYPVSVATLRKQAEGSGLFDCNHVIALGGKEYRAVVQEAFAGYPGKLMFPFSG